MRKIVIFLLILTHSYSNKGWKGIVVILVMLVLRIRIRWIRKILAFPDQIYQKIKKSYQKNFYAQTQNLNYWKKEIIKIFWFIKNSTVLAYNLATNLKILLCKKIL